MPTVRPVCPAAMVSLVRQVKWVRQALLALMANQDQRAHPARQLPKFEARKETRAHLAHKARLVTKDLLAKMAQTVRAAVLAPQVDQVLKANLEIKVQPKCIFWRLLK